MSNFKTVEWTRKIRNENYNKTKNMNKKEIIDYYKQKANKLEQEYNQKAAVKNN